MRQQGPELPAPLDHRDSGAAPVQLDSQRGERGVLARGQFLIAKRDGTFSGLISLDDLVKVRRRFLQIGVEKGERNNGEVHASAPITPYLHNRRRCQKLLR